MAKPNHKPPSVGSNSDKKRKQNPSYKQHHGGSGGGGGGPSVKRGGPGVLLTCETGREMKCQREGMDILQYYLNLQRSERQPSPKAAHSENNDSKNETTDGANHNNNKNNSKEEEGKKFSGSCALDQELEMLRRQQHPKANKLESQHPDFAVYDTGCRGTILVLCTRSNCRVIPPVVVVPKSSKEESVAQDEGSNSANAAKENALNVKSAPEEVSEDAPPSSKRLKADGGETDGTEKALGLPTVESASLNGDPWDPVPMVELIFKESSPDFKGDTLPPSSRFVTRMIPIQATCFASLEEIQPTTKALLERLLSDEDLKQRHEPVAASETTANEKDVVVQRPTTFGIYVKRRNCSHMKTMDIIHALATHVVGPLVPTWKVDLKDPDVKVWVEVCRTTVGLSVFRRTSQHGNANFNLSEVRASTKE